jgi:hypothetical protein
MLAAIAFFALSQSPAPFQPVLAVGTSPVLSKTVHQICAFTGQNDFASAKKALRLLPSYDVKVEWDDSGAPASSRSDFREQEAPVFMAWSNRIPSAHFTSVKKDCDIRITFATTSGIGLEWSEDPAKPRLTAKIGIMPNGSPIDPNGVHNAFSFVVGSYFGITKLPIAGFIMSGSENATPLPMKISALEGSIASTNLVVSNGIREQVQKSVVIAEGVPALAEDPAPIDMGTVLQGTKPPIEVTLNNSGTGKLAYWVIPDCNCFSSKVPRGQIEAKGTANVPIQMDTTEFAGTLHKALFVFTNDATNPVRRIPITVAITPRYRMLPPKQTVVADSDEITFTAYLFTPKDHPLKVKQAEAEGLPGFVTFEPWEGVLADPDMNEEALPRKGYKFNLKLTNIPDGMQMTTNIRVTTNDPVFDEIVYQLVVQKGILAMPPYVFMGEIGAAPRTMAFVVSRPGKAFSVTGIEVDSSHVSATFAPTKTVGEYRVTVTYDGKAASGDYRATILVKTDDPKQPVIQVPVSATVR